MHTNVSLSLSVLQRCQLAVSLSENCDESEEGQETGAKIEVKTETQLPPREVCCEVDEYIRGEQQLANQSPPSKSSTHLHCKMFQSYFIIIQLWNILIIGIQYLICSNLWIELFLKPSSPWNVNEQSTIASTSLGSKQKLTRQLLCRSVLPKTLCWYGSAIHFYGSAHFLHTLKQQQHKQKLYKALSNGFQREEMHPSLQLIFVRKLQINSIIKLESSSSGLV